MSKVLDILDQIVDADQEDLEEIQRLIDQLTEAQEGETFDPPEIEEPPEIPDPPQVPILQVSFDAKSVFVVSDIDTTINWGGDVRDGKSRAKAGKIISRTLTKEGSGFVLINGVSYPVEQS